MSELTGFVEFALGVPGASVYLRGKAEGRKTGHAHHITLTANSDAEIRARLVAPDPGFGAFSQGDL
jgi:phosphoribosylaminoimidazole carboxylase